jgi:hypothetical protein
MSTHRFHRFNALRTPTPPRNEGPTVKPSNAFGLTPTRLRQRVESPDDTRAAKEPFNAAPLTAMGQGLPMVGLTWFPTPFPVQSR